MFFVIAQQKRPWPNHGAHSEVDESSAFRSADGDFFAFAAELQIRFQGFECETDAFNHL